MQDTGSWGRFEDRAGRLVAEIDLAVEVTDAAGRTTSGGLVGTGHRVRLEVADPAVVLAAAGRGATHGVGTRLAERGVRVELHGPRGRIARIDPGRTSRVGAALAGSPHVTLDRAGWAPLARAALAGVVSPSLLRPAAAAVALAAGVALARRRFSTRDRRARFR